jgi:hypothetical protein
MVHKPIHLLKDIQSLRRVSRQIVRSLVNPVWTNNSAFSVFADSGEHSHAPNTASIHSRLLSRGILALLPMTSDSRQPCEKHVSKCSIWAARNARWAVSSAPSFAMKVTSVNLIRFPHFVEFTPEPFQLCLIRIFTQEVVGDGNVTDFSNPCCAQETWVIPQELPHATRIGRVILVEKELGS